jgi:hypothetical protein
VKEAAFAGVLACTSQERFAHDSQGFSDELGAVEVLIQEESGTSAKAQMAERAETPEEARMYWNDALNAGEKLAPFRFARLAAVRLGIEHNDVLARQTPTEKELMSELLAELADMEDVPRQIRDFIASGGTVDLSRAKKAVPATVSPSHGGGVATPTLRYAEPSRTY